MQKQSARIKCKNNLFKPCIRSKQPRTIKTNIFKAQKAHSPAKQFEECSVWFVTSLHWINPLLHRITWKLHLSSPIRTEKQSYKTYLTFSPSYQILLLRKYVSLHNIISRLKQHTFIYLNQSFPSVLESGRSFKICYNERKKLKWKTDLIPKSPSEGPWV